MVKKSKILGYNQILGLLWPALHNLPEYIASDYDDPKVLREHWSSYVRVNYQFAIDSVRNSRPQDFMYGVNFF